MRVRHGHDLALRRHLFRRYLTLAVAPLPRHYLKDIPIADQVKGEGFGVEDIAKVPVSGPFKFESVTPAAELRLVKNPNFTNSRTGAPGQPRPRSSSSGTAIPTP